MGGDKISRAVGGRTVGPDKRGIRGVGEDLGGKEERGGGERRRNSTGGEEGRRGLDWRFEREGS